MDSQLKQLYEHLLGLSEENKRFLTYRNADTKISAEVLKIHPVDNINEQVIISYDGQDTSIVYEGEISSMSETIKNLKLPNSYPENLGERVFYLLNGKLEEMPDNDFKANQEVTLSVELMPGNENKLEYILKKLIDVYRQKTMP